MRLHVYSNEEDKSGQRRELTGMGFRIHKHDLKLAISRKDNRSNRSRAHRRNGDPFANKVKLFHQDTGNKLGE